MWQTLAPAGTAGTDTRRLLDCASRIGREDIVDDISRQLHPEKAVDAGAAADQLDKLERNDPKLRWLSSKNYSARILTIAY